MRNAFSMITALFVIVVMATITALVFSLSGKLVKSTTDQYQREQAMLLAKSFTEYAVMALTANDRINNNCLYTIRNQPANPNDYTVTVQISYIGANAVLGNCTSPTRIFDNAVGEPTTPLTAVIDVYVTYRDPDNPNAAYRFTYHRRTLQKI
jgi:type II secretory pathway pseudopilin PulG